MIDIEMTEDVMLEFMLAAWGGKLEPLAAFITRNPEAVTWRDRDGGTALRKALAHGTGYLETVTLLLDRGSDIDAQDNEGLTPLMFAAMHGKADCLELLLDRGADTSLCDRQGRTAAGIARALGHENEAVMIEAHEKRLHDLSEQARQNVLEGEAAAAHTGLAKNIRVGRPLSPGR
jgi:ankyrin repeat protein